MREAAKAVAESQQRLKWLTGREREILALVTTGLLNKQTAAQLELSETTVKIHRSQLMRKMRARSMVDLVRMADTFGISAEKV